MGDMFRMAPLLALAQDPAYHVAVEDTPTRVVWNTGVRRWPHGAPDARVLVGGTPVTASGSLCYARGLIPHHSRRSPMPPQDPVDRNGFPPTVTREQRQVLEELRTLFLRLSPEQREAVLAVARALVRVQRQARGADDQRE